MDRGRFIHGVNQQGAERVARAGLAQHQRGDELLGEGEDVDLVAFERPLAGEVGQVVHHEKPCARRCRGKGRTARDQARSEKCPATEPIWNPVKSGPMVEEICDSS